MSATLVEGEESSSLVKSPEITVLLSIPVSEERKIEDTLPAIDRVETLRKISMFNKTTPKTPIPPIEFSKRDDQPPERGKVPPLPGESTIGKIITT